MIANLGISTDLFLNGQFGDIYDRHGYTVVRTPRAPDYFFGNLLVLKGRPEDGDLERLERDFSELVGTPPLIKHRTFLWSDQEHVVHHLDAFASAGYSITHNCVLIAGPGDLRCSPPGNVSVQVRRYAAQTDWDNWMAMHLAHNFTSSAEDSFARYLAYQQDVYGKLISSGSGEWWGAFIGAEQVASLGIFFLGRTARFQNVVTAEKYRNKGVCKALVHAVSKASFERADQLVIVADESYHAGHIYQQLGFRRSQWTASLCLEP